MTKITASTTPTGTQLLNRTYTLTLFLAYVQRFQPPLLPGHRLAAADLRHLARRLEKPVPNLRSLRSHWPLATHLVLLTALDLLLFSESRLALSPLAMRWLHWPPAQKKQQIKAVCEDRPSLQAALTRLGLQDTFSSEEIAAGWRTLLETDGRLERQPAQAAVEPRLHTTEDVWRLELSLRLPDPLLFDLLQLGDWSPGAPLVCTPLSIATAVQNGYSVRTIIRLLETATGRPLTPAQKTQLQAWGRRTTTYQIRPVYLLSTRQPRQLDRVLRRKRLRRAVLEQIGPRHAIVSADLIPKLDRWLGKRGYPLDTHGLPEVLSGSRAADEALPERWLGLRLLIGLGEFMPLPYPAPRSSLDALSDQLTAEQQTELEYVAQTTLDALRQVINGRDAFFPASKPLDPALVETVETAIEQAQPLTLRYQSVGELAPGVRTVQPHRLEQRGKLYYLYAYCYRTERPRTFRLDRIHEIVFEG